VKLLKLTDKVALAQECTLDLKTDGALQTPTTCSEPPLDGSEGSGALQPPLHELSEPPLHGSAVSVVDKQHKRKHAH